MLPRTYQFTKHLACLKTGIPLADEGYEPKYYPLTFVNQQK
jgi:hypothetical protein